MNSESIYNLYVSTGKGHYLMDTFPIWASDFYAYLSNPKCVIDNNIIKLLSEYFYPLWRSCANVQKKVNDLTSDDVLDLLQVATIAVWEHLMDKTRTITLPYLSLVGSNAIKNEARILARHGIKGTYKPATSGRKKKI